MKKQAPKQTNLRRQTSGLMTNMLGATDESFWRGTFIDA